MQKTETREYLGLEKLETYQLARQLSRVAWLVYSNLDWQEKKVIGEQFLTATDSCGANIAEGYGRYHYLDKVKFYYNARASLIESLHWSKLLVERKIMTDRTLVDEYKKIYPILSLKLNSLIKTTLNKRNS
ncbi:MAG: four helix bundle protein [Candidatus Moranbacteria bacterium]|nr:four helix bundle protein [Candidatus Moranbacteria bacterium]MBP6034019.1 four helix bundle protein [Candidatus Moranbacteria bacterium]